MTYNAMVARAEGRSIRLAREEKDEAELPDGAVTIRVEYSSVNFKDALALTPDAGVVGRYPIVPGIDLAGEVVASSDSAFAPGDTVLAHGYDIGVARDGAYAELARVPAEWVVPLTELSTREAMAIGTAGFTAALSVQALVQHGITPDRGPVLVTGATGGVGTVSVDLLAAAGFEVVASTGKPEAEELLRALGASSVVGRLPEEPDALTRPLGAQRWAAAVDCVGGDTLAYVLGRLTYGGAVAASGLTGGEALATTVFPFILRGVTLFGIDSVQVDIDARRALWRRLEGDLRPGRLGEVTYEVPVVDVGEVIDRVRAGRSTGRAVARVAGAF